MRSTSGAVSVCFEIARIKTGTLLAPQFSGRLVTRFSFSGTGLNQLAQTLVDVKVPCSRASVVAFDRGRKSYMREAKFSLFSLLGDLKDDIGAVPLRLVLNKVDAGFGRTPEHLLA